MDRAVGSHCRGGRGGWGFVGGLLGGDGSLPCARAFTWELAPYVVHTWSIFDPILRGRLARSAEIWVFRPSEVRPIYDMRHARPRTPRFCPILGSFFFPQKMAKNDKKNIRQNHPNGIFWWFKCIFDTFKGILLSLAANWGLQPR